MDSKLKHLADSEVPKEILDPGIASEVSHLRVLQKVARAEVSKNVLPSSVPVTGS